MTASHPAPELAGKEVNSSLWGPGTMAQGLLGLLGTLYLTYLVGSAHTTPQLLDFTSAVPELSHLGEAKADVPGQTVTKT